MLSPGEISQMGNFNIAEPNIDIYVHTFVAPGNRNVSSNQTSTSNQPNAENTTLSPENLTTNILNSQNQNNNTSTLQQYASLLENMSSMLVRKIVVYIESRRHDSSPINNNSRSTSSIPLNNVNDNTSQNTATVIPGSTITLNQDGNTNLLQTNNTQGSTSVNIASINNGVDTNNSTNLQSKNDEEIVIQSKDK